MSAGIDGLPKGARLLADFAKYCGIKDGCPHFSAGIKGAPKCVHPESSGGCWFENCPLLKGA